MHERTQSNESDEVIALRRRVAELEQQLAERGALDDLAECFQAIFDQGKIGVMMTSPSHRIVRTNLAMQGMLRRSAEELIGMSVFELTYPDDLEATRKIAQSFAAGEANAGYVEKRYLRGDGTVCWGFCTAHSLRDRSGKIRGNVGFIVDLTEQKRSQEELASERQLLRQLLDLLERDRRLITFEIHDGMLQYASAAKMHFESVSRFDDPRCEEALEEYLKGLKLVRETIDEGRRLISGLHPPVLDDAGIIPAIENMLARGSTAGPKIDFVHHVAFDRLSPTLESNIFRIVQEAVTNMRRHSRAEQARIELTQIDDVLRIEIIDWGQGFELSEAETNGHGLKGIRDRARLFHGVAHLESIPGQRTRWLIELPLRLANSPVGSAPSRG